MKTALILAICFMCVLSQFSPTRNITIPQSTIDIDYSPDQQYLGAASTSQLFVFKAYTGEKIASLSFNATQIIQTFAFSRSSKFLAVGFTNGEVRTFGYVNNTFVDQNLTYKYGGTSSIDSVCFNADDSAIVIGVKQNDIVYWLPNGTTVSTTFNGNFVNTLSCSPTDPNLFVVGGYQGSSTNAFIFYKFDGTALNQLKVINGDLTSKI